MSISSAEVVEYTREMSLLYVEDDENLRANMERFFKRIFKSVKSAVDGQQAWELLEANKYDIIISDIKMPRLSGVELFQKIRKKDKKQTLIILSAHDESEHLLELIELDVDGYLLKPINDTKLFELLYKRAKAIFDSRALDMYQKELEDAIQKYESKKSELKNKTVVAAHTSNVKILNRKKMDEKDVESFYNSFLDSDIEELQDDIADLDVALMQLDENTPIDDELFFGTLKSIATMFMRWEMFDVVGDKLIQFAYMFESDPELLNTIKYNSMVARYLESLVTTLDNFLQSVLVSKIVDPTFFNQSLQSDIEQICSLVQPTEDDCEVEFF